MAVKAPEKTRTEVVPGPSTETPNSVPRSTTFPWGEWTVNPWAGTGTLAVIEPESSRASLPETNSSAGGALQDHPGPPVELDLGQASLEPQDLAGLHVAAGRVGVVGGPGGSPGR